MDSFTNRKGGQLTAFFHALFPVFVAAITIVPIHGFAQVEDLDIVFYNVENLFDTIDNLDTYDEDFTPSGKLSYSTERYETKLNHISTVIDSVFSRKQLDIIGLCEVENSQVLEDLTLGLSEANWKIVHVDSPDGRGIDNALIYNGDRLEVKQIKPIEIDLGENERPTRYILMVRLLDMYTDEVLIVYVNHWPSRYGGQLESNWKRIRASETLQESISKIAKKQKNGIVVMGDFNDHPDNESVLGLVDCDTGSCLNNLFEQFNGTDNGTHVYKGEWGVLDQILVSKNLMNGQSGYSVVKESVGPYKRDFMLYEDKKTGSKFPSRTYGGPNYYGGYSDHLPVKVSLSTIHKKR